jgi:hypothetical protein
MIRRTGNATTITLRQPPVDDDDHSEDSSVGSGVAPMDLIHVDTAQCSRSESPMTPEPPPYEARKYPPIPEALPPSMLQFAVSHSINSETIAQGQIVLVLALCCPSECADEWSSPNPGGRWSIPGVDIQTMVLSWLDLVPTTMTENSNSKNKDSLLLALTIAQALTDLLAARWQPHPGTTTTLVDGLLQSARVATRILLSSRWQQDVTLLSIVAEVVAALSSLGSNGLIPACRFATTVEELCALKVDMVSGMMDDNTKPFAPAIEEQRESTQLEVFNVQRDACIGDISGLLWVLLAKETSAGTVIDALLEILNAVNSFSPLCKLSTPDWTEDQSLITKQAGVAMRAISVAVWGNPPQTLIVPSLRIYWHATINVLHQVSSSVVVWMEQFGGCDDDGLSSALCTVDLCELAQNCFECLNMAIEKEICGGRGSLTGSEWDVLVLCLQEGILPWLSSPKGDKHTLRLAQSVFLLLGDFLDKCTQVVTVPCAEFGLQKRLYELILRDVTPCLPESISGPLGSATIRCWAKFGVFPHKLEEWSRTVMCLLEEAFRRSESNTYVHPAHVRLEALRVITVEDGPTGNAVLSTVEDEEPERDRRMPIPSLLVITQHVREQYLELIGTSVIPVLKEIMFSHGVAPSQNDESTESPATVTQVQDSWSEEKALAKDTAEALCRGMNPSSSMDSHALELYAVRLVGGLYRGVSGDRNHRALFISILHSVARNRVFLEDESLAECQDARKLSHPFSIRAAAANELVRCLEASCTTLPHSHECVPRIVEALCALLDDFSVHLAAGMNDAEELRGTAVLAITAVDALSRLRVTIDHKVSFHPQLCQSVFISDFIFDFLSKQLRVDPLDRWPVTKTRDAPFLTSVEGESKEEMLQSRTKVSFQRILNSTSVRYLVASADASTSYQEDITTSLVCMRVSCFDLMRSLALSNVYIALSQEIASKVFTMRQPNETADNSAMNLALDQYVQTTLLVAAGEEKDVLVLDGTKVFFRLFLNSLTSLSDLDCIARLKLIPGLLPTVNHLDFCYPSEGLIVDLLSRIESIINEDLRDPPRVQHQSSARKCIALLSIVFDYLYYSEERAHFSENMLLSLFRFAFHVLVSREDNSGYGTFLALRCLVASIDVAGKSGILEMERFVKSANFSGAQIFRSITTECIRKRAMDLLDRSTLQKEQCESFLLKHEMLAIETKKMEIFEVERCSSSGIELAAAWLYGEDGLLSFRIGSSTSRYSGWIEVMLRTLSSRSRILLSIPGRPSLAEPDIPFLAAASGYAENWPKDLVNKEILPASNDSKINSSEVTLERARAVMARFNLSTGMHDKKIQSKPIEPVIQTDRELPESNLTGTHREPVAWLKHALQTTLDEDAQAVFREVETLLLSKAFGQNAAIMELPQPLRAGKQLKRGLAVLDRTPITNTHKVALLYDRSGLSDMSTMDSEAQLLGVSKCSPSFHRFVEGIGELIPTRQLNYFSAGLDVSANESDGEYSLVWMNDRSLAATNMIVFHVSSLMPESVVARKSHIGNDNVLVLFSDAGSDALVGFEHQDFERSIVGGAFGFVTIFVKLSLDGSCRVSVRVRETLTTSLGDFTNDWILPEENTPSFVRSLAIRADLACLAVIDSSNCPSNLLRRKELLGMTHRFLAR